MSRTTDVGNIIYDKSNHLPPLKRITVPKNIAKFAYETIKHLQVQSSNVTKVKIPLQFFSGGFF